MLFKIRFFLLGLLTGITVNAGEIRIAVSDLIADHISGTIQTLAEESALDTSVISIGSLPAMDYLRSDDISLALIAVPEGSELPGDEFNTFTFAYSTAIVAVSEANPINSVCFEDLRGIFGSDPDSNIDNWEALGIKSLGNRSVKPLIKQDEAGISTELFRHTVLHGEAMKRTVNEVIGSEIKEMLINNMAAIAVLPHLPNGGKVKALMVSVDSESLPFDPTNDNVYHGDYPIRLPFQIVYKEDREAELVGILRILLSNQMTEVLEENYLFVPPETIRKGFADNLVPDE